MGYKPKTGEEALEKPSLILEISYYIQQQVGRQKQNVLQ